MTRLDRSIMEHLGLLLRTEYDLPLACPATIKQREVLFRYALAEAALEAERRSHEARLRLRGLVPDLLSSAWSDKVVA